jgi:predicted RNA-binding Zn-ribbon protein involved in translation (DUF1610 family)
LRRAVQISLVEGRTDIRCLHTDCCGAKIHAEVIASVLEPVLVQRLFETEHLNEVSHALGNVGICGGCGVAIELLRGVKGYDCPGCGAHTCGFCGRVHDGLCPERVEADEREALEVAQLVLQWDAADLAAEARAVVPARQTVPRPPRGDHRVPRRPQYVREGYSAWKQLPWLAAPAFERDQEQVRPAGLGRRQRRAWRREHAAAKSARGGRSSDAEAAHARVMQSKKAQAEEGRSSAAIKTIPACPSCGLTTERSAGCSHMTCPRCGTAWCYNCGVRQGQCRC